METKQSRLRWAFYFFLVLSTILVARLGGSVLNLEFEDDKQILGVWQGSYQEFRNQKIPFPVIFDFQPGGKLSHLGIGFDDEKRTDWKIREDKLMLDTFEFDLIDINDDSLAYSYGRKLVLKRLNSKLPGKNTQELRTFLENSTWQCQNNKKRYLQFKDSTVIFQLSDYRETRCWDIFQFKDALFLYLKETVSCGGGNGRIHQVIDFNANRLVLESQNELESKKLIYTRVEKDPAELIDNKSAFQLCGFSGVFNHLSISDAHDKGGRFIQDYYFENFECLPSWKGLDGYLRLKFVINCEGETGNYDWQTMDKSYAQIEFPEALTNHLLDLHSKIKGWKSLERNDRLVDAWKSVIFKIEDGNLTSVSP